MLILKKLDLPSCLLSEYRAKEVFLRRLSLLRMKKKAQGLKENSKYMPKRRNSNYLP